MKVSRMIEILTKLNPDSEMIMHNSVVLNIDGTSYQSIHDVLVDSIYNLESGQVAISGNDDINIKAKSKIVSIDFKFDEI